MAYHHNRTERRFEVDFANEERREVIVDGTTREHQTLARCAKREVSRAWMAKG